MLNCGNHAKLLRSHETAEIMLNYWNHVKQSSNSMDVSE